MAKNEKDKQTNRQTIVHMTQHRKIKNRQHENYKLVVWLMGIPELKKKTSTLMVDNDMITCVICPCIMLSNFVKEKRKITKIF